MLISNTNLRVSGTLNVTSQITEQGQILIQKYGLSGTVAPHSHTGYEISGSAEAWVDAHVAESDPHSQYLTEAEGNTLYSLSGASSFSGLTDVQDAGWTSGMLPRFNGQTWVPYYDVSGTGAAYSAGSGLISNNNAYHVQVGSGLYLTNDLVGLNKVYTDTQYQQSGTVPSHNHDGVYEISGTVDAHKLETDPHPIYLTSGEGDVRYSLSGTGSSTTFSGLSDTQNTGWTSGMLARFNGTEWVPYYDVSGAAGNYEASGTAEAWVDAHVAEADPHSQYLTSGEGDVRYALSGAAGGSTTFSGLDDIQSTGWSSGQMPIFNGVDWIPIERSSLGQSGAASGNMLQTKTLLDEQIISGSVTQIDFTNISGTDYDWYEIEWAIVGTLDQDLYLYWNNNTTSTNYARGEDQNASYSNTTSPKIGRLSARSNVKTMGSAKLIKEGFVNAVWGGRTNSPDQRQTGHSYITGPYDAAGIYALRLEPNSSNIVGSLSSSTRGDSWARLYGIEHEVINTGSSTTSGLFQVRKVFYDTTLTANSGAFDITNIPQTYDSIEIVARCKHTGTSSESLLCYFNNDTTSGNYRRVAHWGDVSSDGSTGTDDARIGIATGSGDPSDSYGYTLGRIDDYTRTDLINKELIGSDGHRGAGTEVGHTGNWMQWESTAAINRIRIQHASNNLVSGSRVQIILVGEQWMPTLS